MKLNESKSKLRIFNRTRNYQFSTRINNSLLEIVNETRLLGTILTSDLSWHKNSESLALKGYQRMVILRKLYEFNVPQKDLVQIYYMYIRSILEYNSSVWFSAITQEEKNNIERVQRIACRIILKEKYTSYEEALEHLDLQNLNQRRIMLASRFAKKCTQHEKFRDLFPKTENPLNLRTKEEYKVKFASTQKLYKSAIPTMQRLLNSQSSKK